MPLFLASLSAFAAVLLATGCASGQHNSTHPRPGSGIAQYRQVTMDAQKALRRAMASLATVSAQSNQCPPKVVTAFSTELQRLQVKSMQIRERSQAMQARGDAYFQSWHEQLARVQDPKFRALAEQHRPELQEDFMKIKELSRQARESFAPFLAGLRSVRNSLEKDPSSLGTAEIQNTIAATKQHGDEVQRCLADIRHVLDSAAALLNLPHAT